MKKVGVILFLLLLGWLSYRSYYLKDLGMERIPKTTTILDEKDYAWVGYSFRRGGISSGWSMMEGAYKKAETISAVGRKGSVDFDGLSLRIESQRPTLINSRAFGYPITRTIEVDMGKGKEQLTIVQPFLDHSPLAGIIYSLKIPPIKSVEDIKVGDYRSVAVSVALLSGIIIALIAWVLSSSKWVSLFSLVIYSSSSIFVLGSRYALIENIMIPLFGASWLCLLLYKKYQGWGWLLLSAGLAGLTLLTKESGIFAIIAGVLVLIEAKSSKKGLIWFGLISLGIGSLYYLYAWWLSPELARQLFLGQSGRSFFGSLNFLAALPMPKFDHFPLDGYWLWGWAGMLLLGRLKKYRSLLIYCGSYLVIMLLMGGANYPWYYLPFAPFLAIGGGALLERVVFRPTWQSLLAFLVLPLSTSFYWGFMVYRQNLSALTTYRLLLLFLISGGILIGKKKGTRGLWSLGILLLIYQLYKWNIQGVEYIIGNWEKLPLSMLQ